METGSWLDDILEPWKPEVGWTQSWNLRTLDMQNVQLQTVPNPCLDTTPQSTIADMCTTDYATEENNNGGTTVDSVALRVMTQQDGCTCEVTLQNQTSIYTIYMRKYDLMTNAAPGNQECGLAIEMKYSIPNNIPDTKDPVECTKGTDTRSISLSKNGVLVLRSTIIGGIFDRGYCIQIFRQHSTGDNLGIQINCSHPNMQTTQQTNNAAIQDKTVSENDNVRLPVIIAAVIGWCLVALFFITACYLYRRKRKAQPNIAVEQNVNPQNEDLHALRLSSCYSSLNSATVTVSSNAEQYEHMGLP
ncbi:unnamed protein product [Mytilus coruscus]|uniref:Uncharacterized protein n=1 Tax=Mytilus coruscus TaxID=42192 RepID=A0A6J8AR04_MYTCO|nr:unnamed protein product [Mytilus coruscus]